MTVASILTTTSFNEVRISSVDHRISLFSYPTKVQFKNIGESIVQFLKLPITTENVVSSSISYEFVHRFLSCRRYGKMHSKQNLSENDRNIFIILLFNRIE